MNNKRDLVIGSHSTLADGSVVEWLPEFRVTFGAHLSSQEPPITGIASEAAAVDIVRGRYPRALVETWSIERIYADGALYGWMSTPFYAGPTESFAGYIEWRFRRAAIHLDNHSHGGRPAAKSM